MHLEFLESLGICIFDMNESKKLQTSNDNRKYFRQFLMSLHKWKKIAFVYYKEELNARIFPIASFASKFCLSRNHAIFDVWVFPTPLKLINWVRQMIFLFLVLIFLFKIKFFLALIKLCYIFLFYFSHYILPCLGKSWLISFFRYALSAFWTGG